jgi:hypothetical protein
MIAGFKVIKMLAFKACLTHKWITHLNNHSGWQIQEEITQEDWWWQILTKALGINACQ